ncbi:MAG: hypothetical protein Satyrvirus6_10 [Satyrvirus sp.]|uniref:NADAR domain-containing protein n=1 Tax=Satyrvirus sp. TaxID=2487771 RepID=A0A3G5ADI0_9VIRU|nr:MAG: hypothetical protein Satyrvirus6_10 [Satyrvirus sp.]
METDTHVLFYGHKNTETNFNIFSQWFPAKFIEKRKNGNIVQYLNAEQYMMAHKALLFGDRYIFEKIMKTSKPSSIKFFGRKVKKFDSDVWDKYKFSIVVQGNRLKFEQNPDLLKRLLETGNKTIVEASPYDEIWGIGLSVKQAVKVPEEEWPGKNLLGKALMLVRDENKKKIEINKS